MIGQTVESRHFLPWEAFCLFLAAAAMLFAAVLLNNMNWAVGAILPLLAGTAIVLARLHFC